jgi:hypothetical protein
MWRRKRREAAEGWQEVDRQPTNPCTTEAPLLLIDELEPRLTPDGWSPPGSPHNNPPSGQVGWGC